MARIRIFNNISEPNRVDKSDYITQTLILDGSFRDSVSITHPVIDIKSKNIIDGNYIYIEEFNRYYFVRSIEIVRTGLYRMYCDVDVLMSFKTEIGNLKAVVKRNEFTYDNNLRDSEVVVSSPTTIIKEELINNVFNGEDMTEASSAIVWCVVEDLI